MKAPGWRQWLLLAAFALVVIATAWFAWRAVRRAAYWRHHHDEPIHAWMSVPYVAHSYRVPPFVLYRALGIPRQERDRRPLREIAREQHRPVEELITTLEQAIAEERRSHPPGQPSVPDQGRSP
jgi:ABC-type nickel/cobalt efflux system permease component RcnA